MSTNQNGGHANIANDPDVLNYVESKRRIQEALLMAQEAERQLDRSFEAKLQEKVAEGQKALKMLSVLQSKRITGAPVPQTAPAAVSYSQQQISGRPSYATAPQAVSHSSAAAGIPNPQAFAQYSSSGQNQQYAAQHSGHATNYATANVSQGGPQSAQAGSSHSAGAPMRPAAGYQPQAQYSQAPVPVSQQLRGQRMQGSEQVASQQPGFMQPMMGSFVVGPQSYQGTYGGVSAGMTRIRSGGGNSVTRGGNPSMQQWEANYVANNGAPINYGINPQVLVNSNAQAAQHIQRSASSTLEGALGPSSSMSSNSGPSNTLAPKANNASAGGSTLQANPNTHLSSNQSQSGNHNSTGAVAMQPAEHPVGVDSAMSVPRASVLEGAAQARAQPVSAPPPSRPTAINGFPPDMEDIQSRAKVSNSTSQKRTPTHSNELPQEQISRPTIPLPNQQTRQTLPAWHATGVPLQSGSTISGPSPYGTTQPQGFPTVPHRVFVPPRSTNASASRSDRASTPQREKESTPPVTPASAKKQSLAKDILFALGMSRKRKSRSDDGIENGSEHPEEESVRKKLATGMQLTDDEHETMQVDGEPSSGVHSDFTADDFTADPSLSVLANLPPTSNDVDTVTAISAGIAQVVSEVQSSVNTPKEIITSEGPSIVEFSTEGGVAPFQPESATIVELPDDESETTVELGLAMEHPEVAPQLHPSSARLSPPVDWINNADPNADAKPSSSRPPSVKHSSILDLNDDVGPLFLPSPSPEPQSAASRTAKKRSTEAGPSWSRPNSKTKAFQEVYIEVPPLPKWASEARSVSELDGPTPVPKRAPAPPEPVKEANANVEAPETKLPKYTGLEVMQESMSRLHHRTCGWPNCTRSFNTAFKLQNHINDHIQIGPEPAKALFRCEWEGCENRMFNNDHAFLKHTQNHVARLQQCSVAGCNEEFKQLKELVAHWEKDHPGERNLRPDDKPFHPATTSHLPNLPDAVPAYASIIGPQCRPSLISKEKHQEIGPRILKRIFGPVNLNVPRLSARFPLRSAQQQQFVAFQSKKHDEFDFLSSAASRPFSDIPSAFVSDIVEANVLMEPVDEPPQGEFGEVIIASDRIPDEVRDASDREDDAPAAPADSGVDVKVVEVEKNDNGESNLKVSESQPSADVDRNSESSVDGLV